MKIISESHNLESKEMFPQVLLRIYSICKNDSNFPLKSKLNSIEGEAEELQKQIDRKNKLLEKSGSIYREMKQRLDNLDEKNYEMKSRLLEELGSDI